MHKEKGIWKLQLIDIVTRLFIENNGKEVLQEEEQSNIDVVSNQESNQSESNSKDDMSLCSVVVAEEV